MVCNQDMVTAYDIHTCRFYIDTSFNHFVSKNCFFVFVSNHDLLNSRIKYGLNLFGQSLEIPTIVPERFEAAQTEDAAQRPA